MKNEARHRFGDKLKFDNLADPNRPLTVSAMPDGGIEIRIGRMGITDAVATLNDWQADCLAAFIGEVAA